MLIIVCHFSTSRGRGGVQRAGMGIGGGVCFFAVPVPDFGVIPLIGRDFRRKVTLPGTRPEAPGGAFSKLCDPRGQRAPQMWGAGREGSRVLRQLSQRQRVPSR